MVANDERQKIMTANSLSDMNVPFLENRVFISYCELFGAFFKVI